MQKDIFVPGLLDWQRKALDSVTDSKDYRFHSLLSFEELVEHPPGFELLLARARQRLDGFAGRPAALICHWDFPSSCLSPILAREYGLQSPTLKSVLQCEHKYWARLQQREAVPECVPEFQVLDPFDRDAAGKLRLDFPIWLKPVKAYSSILGFHIENREQLELALAEMRQHIGELGDLFDECLVHEKLPANVAGIGGRHAIAESIMHGEQFACEGFVFQGEIGIHGFLEMMLGHDGRDIQALVYPAALPPALLEHSKDVARRILRQVGFDNGCFNIEFLWDASRDKLWLVEVNTRMSQSHSELFRHVDGISNHEVAIDVAMGRKPKPMTGGGSYGTAAKVLLTKTDDAEVLRVPRAQELKSLAGELGDALIVIDAKAGTRLADLVHQGKYSYIVGEAWIGADSREELARKHRLLVDRLPLQFSDGKGLDDVDWSPRSLRRDETVVAAAEPAAPGVQPSFRAQAGAPQQ